MRKFVAAAAVVTVLAGCQSLAGPGQAGRLERQIGEIQARLAKTEAEIQERTSAISTRTDGIHARVAYRPVVAWAEAFSSGPEASRTINFQQTRSAGYISHVSRHCRVPSLIRAGHYTEIDGANATRASVLIREFVITPGDDGLTLRSPISLNARTQVKGQYLPACTGSSVGTTVGVTGEANPTGVFRLRFANVENDAVRYSMDMVSPARIGLELAFHLNGWGRIRFTVPMEGLTRQIASGSVDLLLRQDGTILLPDGQVRRYRVATIAPQLQTDGWGLHASSGVELVIEGPDESTAGG
jgi:hypothetical protein